MVKLFSGIAHSSCSKDTALQTSRKRVVTVSKAFVTPVMLPGITKLRIRIRNTEVTVQRSGKRLVQRWPVVGGPIGKRSVRAAVSSGLQERRQPAVRESGSVQWSANNGG